MKKILMATDGGNFSEGAFDFARKMNEQASILLVGIFLPQPELARSINYDAVLAPLTGYTRASLDESVALFEQQCRRYDIKFTVHKNLFDFALTEIKKETRFADMLLLGSEKFHNDISLYGPAEFLGGTLHQSECPIIVTPEKFSFPESVILAYDGSPSAAYAIKSFTYLFPYLCNRQCILVYSNIKENAEIPDLDRVHELAGIHFSNLSIRMLNADPQKYFDTWLSEIKRPIVISGSYSRSAVSRTFKRSFVSQILADHKLPLYIAHH